MTAPRYAPIADREGRNQKVKSMPSQPRKPEAPKAQEAKAGWAAGRSFFRGVLHCLRFRRRRAADEVEKLVRLLDNGAFDHLVTGAVGQERPAPPNAYKELEAFSYTRWKERHGIKD